MFKKKMTICKDCAWKIYDEFLEESGHDERMSVYRMCRLLDVPFLETPFNSASSEADEVGTGNTFKKYMKNINSLRQYSTYVFENGDSLEQVEKKQELEIYESVDEREKKNEEDVLRILGFDPFVDESPKDRKFLFNRLVDYLDDSVLEDNVKLSSVISVVKGFNQIEYVDKAIATMTKDMSKLISSAGGMKTLVETKKNLTQIVLKLAEDNGLSEKFNSNKSKGAGSLSGMVKTLDELGLESARVNLFDIETSKAMADADWKSHENIMKQLQLTDNEYAECVAQQRDMIKKMDKKLSYLEEENRLLKVSMRDNGLDYRDIEKKEGHFIDVSFKEEDIYKTEYNEISQKAVEVSPEKEEEKNDEEK